MKKVVIGMSGGVDSAVAGLLLKNAGYEVIGLFMRNWDSEVNSDVLGNPNATTDVCTQDDDYNDAKAVCDKLNIPIHEVNFVREYWDYVFSYFLDELKKGRTPNPDIMCNKFIKFDLFKIEAEKLGADYIATGHYARLRNGKLLRGLDDNKDQTYFLCQVNKDKFDNVLFPIGEYNKSEIRKMAEENDLIVFDKKDSTGICFIGERKFKDFLKNYLPVKKGSIINIKTSETIGEHSGLMNYTIGQRRGLDIGGTKDKLFVIGKNLEDNVLYVCEGENNEYLYSDGALVTDFNWLSDIKGNKCTAKFRYRQKDIDVTIEKIDNTTIKVLYDNVKAVTPGQACVLYNNEVCLGGGIIEEVYKNDEKINYL